eukprot:Clim_evm91s128 gene=Clim_evmTU91s128
MNNSLDDMVAKTQEEGTSTVVTPKQPQGSQMSEIYMGDKWPDENPVQRVGEEDDESTDDEDDSSDLSDLGFQLPGAVSAPVSNGKQPVENLMNEFDEFLATSEEKKNDLGVGTPPKQISELEQEYEREEESLKHHTMDVVDVGRRDLILGAGDHLKEWEPQRAEDGSISVDPENFDTAEVLRKGQSVEDLVHELAEADLADTKQPVTGATETMDQRGSEDDSSDGDSDGRRPHKSDRAPKHKRLSLTTTYPKPSLAKISKYEESSDNDEVSEVRSSFKKKNVTWNLPEDHVENDDETLKGASQRRKASPIDLLILYKNSTQRLGVAPNMAVVRQIEHAMRNGKQMTSFIWNRGKMKDAEWEAVFEVLLNNPCLKTIATPAAQFNDKKLILLFKVLQYRRTVENLDISNSQMRDMCYREFSNTLARCPNLRYINLSGITMEPRGINLVSRALGLSQVNSVKLERCALYQAGALESIANGCRRSDILTHLSLQRNGFSPRNGRAIGNLMRKVLSVTHLDLSHNQLRDEGVLFVADAIANLEGLKSVSLRDNGIGVRGMQSLSGALMATKSLECLDLSGNKLSSEAGVMSLKTALVGNRTITTLRLMDTGMRPEGAITFAEALTENKTLLTVDLRQNKIQTAGIMALAVSMRSNHSVLSMGLDPDGGNDTPYGKEFLEEVMTLCNRNVDEAHDKSSKGLVLSYGFPHVEGMTTIVPSSGGLLTKPNRDLSPTRIGPKHAIAADRKKTSPRLSPRAGLLTPAALKQAHEHIELLDEMIREAGSDEHAGQVLEELYGECGKWRIQLSNAIRQCRDENFMDILLSLNDRYNTVMETYTKRHQPGGGAPVANVQPAG